jgi:ketosteroid isomerase-like protein
VSTPSRSGRATRGHAGATQDNDYAVVFRVVDGLIDAVTEYFDTGYLRRVLLEQDGDQVAASR